MIERRTTLILGAGASAPFGFPTGYELLCQAINWQDINPELSISNLFPDLKKTEIKEFKEALRRSGKMSVDAFLEHRPEFIPIGKSAMAMILIQHEHEPHLFRRDGKSWYEYLFNQLNTTFEKFDKNRLSILTFNYDRSLEHFLFTALKNTSGKSEDECAEKLKSIPIIHLHGDLGALPHSREHLMRTYNSELTPTTVNIATNRIKIIHEGIATNDPQFEQARQILLESEVICFLGFGYHRLNMERLGMNNCQTGMLVSKQIIGTTFGLTHAEFALICQRHKLSLRSGRLEYQNFDVFQFFREMAVLHGS
jgi:hypothetical protein